MYPKKIEEKPSPSVAEQQPPPPSPMSPPFLHHELTAEILSWLPVKPLLRFKCVCRSWNSLISDQNFAKLHLHRSHKNDANLILTLYQPLPVERKIMFVSSNLQSFTQNASSAIAAAPDGLYSLKNKYRVLGSCNGLVCIRSNFPNLDDEHIAFWFCVWNPVLRFRSKKLLGLPKLLVDPIWPTRFGFGYDEFSDTYKVVAILCKFSKKTQVKVYSLGHNCWRDIQSFPDFPNLVLNEPKFVSGTVNWIAIPYIDLAWETLVIVSLDIGKETCKQLLLPTGIDEFSQVHAPALEVLRGCLCLVHDYKGTHFVVWQMKEFGVEHSWTRIFKVSYRHLLGENYPGPAGGFDAVQILGISENGDLMVLADNDNSAIVLYDRKDNTAERTKILNSQNWIYAEEYVESLIMPRC